MNIQVPDIVYWIWGLTLAIAVFVILPLALYFLQRTLNAARSIERYFAEMRDAGVGIANNTGNIKALDNTISVATQILSVAGSINDHAAAIENTFVARTGGNGRE
ncbi:MAG: hypothetical protein HY741_13110 [Chloroflexi bacterium]|nr:hypothetical protein [Chloroflexota bacterium]